MKKTIRIISYIGCFFIVLLLLSGCQSLLSDNPQASLGGEDSATTVNEQKWPTGLPPDIPVLEKGTIMFAESNNNITSIWLRDLTKEDLSEYIDKIVESGFEVKEKDEAAGKWTLQKENTKITINHEIHEEIDAVSIDIYVLK